MSATRKRPLTVEGEGESKESRDKEKKTVPQSRPPKPSAKKRKTTDSSDAPKTLESKTLGKGKRQAWTKAAIDAFFEGLLQHGKDFQKILKYMQSKQKKLNDPTIGNLTKDQVRFFYYRNWHKVEPLLNSQHHSSGDNRRTSKSSAPQTPVTPFSESNEDSAAEDHHGTETENFLDSSVEELDPPSPSATGTSQEQEVKAIPSPGGRVTTEKNKEQVQASPITTSTDKSEGKVKDTVLVNGTKQSLDLVALICYNKLRKKSLGDHNIGRRLSELVFQGVTSVPSRVKGKRKAQIRIPNCGAFRGPVRKPTTEEQPGSSESTADSCPTADGGPSESAQGAESKPLTGDEEMVVELRPLTSSTWLHVQALSHNPRVRMHVDGSGSLSTLRDYLELKWKLNKSHSLKFYDTECLHSTPVSTSQSNHPPTSHPHSRPLHEPHTSHQSSPSHTHQSSPSHTLQPSPTAALTPEREAVSLPSSPTKNINSSATHRNCQSVPATPSSEVTRLEGIKTGALNETRSEVTEMKQPERSEVVEDKACERSEVMESEPVLSDNAVPAKECVDVEPQKSPIPIDDQCSSHSVETRRGFTESVKNSEVDLTSTLKEVATKRGNSRCVQLCYEISKVKEVPDSQSTDRLRAALKLVEFFIKRSPSDQSQSPFLLSPVKKSPVIAHRSPKVREYMQTLNRHSPQKSPLSKYRRLKQKSPLKRISTTPSRTINRVQLSFSSEDATTPSVSSSSSSQPSTPVFITTLNTGDKTPQAIQLGSPKSIGSFANFKIQSLFPKANKQPQPSASKSQTVSSSQSPLVQVPLSTQQLNPSSQAQLLTTPRISTLVPASMSSLSTASTGMTPGYMVLNSTSSSVATPTGTAGHVISSGTGARSHGAPLLAPLAPGVHRIQPRVPSNTAPQPSHDLTVSMSGASQGSNAHGNKSNVVPIMSALKPFKKPKRIKKLPAKPGQPHQLVPRPIPFLRDVNLGSNSSGFSGPSVSVTQSTQSQLTPALSTPPLSVSKHSSPRKTTAALIQNQHLLLQLIQSYMLQQQRAQLSKSKLQTVAHPSQTPVTQATSSVASSLASVQAAVTSNQPRNISEKDLQNTLVDNFLAEGVATDSTSVSKLFNTSSDTVNDLLRGLSSVKPSDSIQKLSEETADVLPTFAKALGNSFLSSESKDAEMKESAGSVIDCNTQASASIESEEAVGPSVEDKMNNVFDSIPKPDSEDGQLPFMHDASSTSLTDILGTLTDSNFKQVADNGDFFEHIDFTDMFSQLKDVITPEKEKHPSRGEDSQSSIGNLLEYVNSSPEKKAYTAPVDPACRSFLEESSVDFIQKFKELASTMEGHSSTH